MYTHLVQYYETDKMGVTHHSNYIRWMEEARISFLEESGWSFSRLEAEGLVSPVFRFSRYRSWREGNERHQGRPFLYHEERG